MISMDKKYWYRNGQPARILCVDGNNKTYPVISMGEFGELYSHLPNGAKAINERCDAFDLVEIGPYDDFKIDEPVMVRMRGHEQWYRAYFAGIDGNGAPKAFSDGQTQWVSKGESFVWSYCRRPTEEELKV